MTASMTPELSPTRWLPRSMTRRLLLLMLLISLLPASFVGWIGYQELYNEIRDNKIRDVGKIATNKHHDLANHLGDTRDRIEQFLVINQHRCSTYFSQHTPAYRACLRDALDTFVKNEHALGAVLRGESNIEVGQITAALPAEAWSLQAGQLAVFPPAEVQQMRVFHVPVIESQTRLQLVLIYPVSALQTLFSTPDMLGQSGETFLADHRGYFITEPRYRSTQGHSMAISAAPMQQCLQQRTMQMLELDYRAIPIIHGFEFVPEVGGGCIMAHIDQQEAFAPLQQLRRNALLIAFSLSALIIGFAVVLNRLITRPLTRLSETLASIKDGSEKVVFDDQGPSEIVALNQSYAQMIERLHTLIEHQATTLSELRDSNAKLEEAQSHLMQSEKMASIGQLAAGVAHEINNPIGFVYSNLNTLEKYVQDSFNMIDLYEQAESAITDPAVHANLKAAKVKLDILFLKEDLRALMDESKDGITRVKQIVQNLKDFSHVDASDEWRSFNLHHGINSTLNIVNNEIKYKAEVIKEFGELPEIECLPSQLNQVVMNLLVNAAHAIEQQGTITLRTGVQGDEVWLEVSDTGKGIAPEHLQKIFDPFFTTKPIGKGTGLGLSLSYGIIKKHHGRIEVSSEVGKGTTFKVWLPIKQPKEAPV